jgi:uncharacterized membrane protein
MMLLEIAPILAAVAALAYVFFTLSGPARPVWQVPAVLSAAFLLWTMATIAHEGLAAVWQNHTQNFWGNQVWFDLLLAVVIGWTLILPRARAQRMQVLPWLLLICATASIGTLAMLARVIYLEEKAAKV